MRDVFEDEILILSLASVDRAVFRGSDFDRTVLARIERPPERELFGGDEIGEAERSKWSDILRIERSRWNGISRERRRRRGGGESSIHRR